MDAELRVAVKVDIGDHDLQLAHPVGAVFPFDPGKIDFTFHAPVYLLSALYLL